MKGQRLALLASAALIGVALAMTLTNPDEPEYETFATQRLSVYLQDNVCTDLPTLLGNNLSNACVELVNTNQPQIRSLITKNTLRRDFTFLSLYTTDLRPQDLLPSDVQAFLPPGTLPAYRVETVGAFNRFWIYRAEQQQ
ncbi:DUF4359 domain-containing protein [Leptolyngbya sp. AN02str]|uniref:DUF4359 domain-containing protein n=1 Tax=Leptolyngbya sp. AN02str TaxID=3423363 RepID=UPI003D3116A3